MRLESLKEDNFYTGDKPLEFILVPKCSLFRDSTVVIITDKKLMFSLHSQLTADEYPIPGYGNEDPRMLGSPYPRE